MAEYQNHNIIANSSAPLPPFSSFLSLTSSSLPPQDSQGWVERIARSDKENGGGGVSSAQHLDSG